jgi:hypothetical protein
MLFWPTELDGIDFLAAVFLAGFFGVSVSGAASTATTRSACTRV